MPTMTSKAGVAPKGFEFVSGDIIRQGDIVRPIRQSAGEWFNAQSTIGREPNCLYLGERWECCRKTKD